MKKFWRSITGSRRSQADRSRLCAPAAEIVSDDLILMIEAYPHKVVPTRVLKYVGMRKGVPGWRTTIGFVSGCLVFVWCGP